MKITSKTYSIFVGAGITKDSNPDNEWKELQNKSENIIKYFVVKPLFKIPIIIFVEL